MRRQHVNLLSVLSKNIKQRRKELGISQEKLAEIAGISPNYVARMEVLTSSPSLGTLTRIADALGVTVSDLLAEHEPRPSMLDERINNLIKTLPEDDAKFLAKEVTEWVHRLSKKGSS